MQPRSDERMKHPAKSLAPETRYEKIGVALGAQGYFVKTPDELEDAMKKATQIKPFQPAIINCMISTTASRGKRKDVLLN